MTLHLDARQRAMLQEMGIALPVAPARAAAAPMPVPPLAQPSAELRGSAPPRQAAARPPAPVAVAPEAAQPAPAAAPASTETAAAQVLLAAPVAPYAVDLQAGPAEPGGWLVLLECAQPGEPLAGDAGLLLNNMLRAIGLHHHQRSTHVAALLPAGAAQPGAAVPAAAGQPLADVLAALRPAMVLLLGRGAARAVLGSHEPLAQLRSSRHRLADGTPAAVSHDPAYLLHAQDAKAAAWLDLCRALARARAQA
ncbi:hypothetical protein C6568_10320 [Melaminivora suipulveris]|uniref:Uracil-DNA glycosylase-like domain-containing protein n=1 Tax=Melaminivora suipulveris TaxID=2109913 RepID=A0A2R3QCY0_9BURK|nr:uracil-DNA glycosylase family protein [Melaminivora suipulveris]AVO49620.1 hypothetical protein C6568_10320 [Melaminivora suipulveris]